MPELSKKIAEIDANFEAFEEMLPSIKDRHSGKFALMRDKEIVNFFDSAGDALTYAEEIYEDGLYSIQEVTDEVEDLGFFSHALDYKNI